MVSRNILVIAIILTIATIVAIGVTVNISSIKKDEKVLFPGIVGDMALQGTGVGIHFIRNITVYDDFRGDIVQGYKATYFGENMTMIIFLVQMQDNISANRSLKDMAIRAGFNESTYNESEIPIINKNNTIVRLPVKNPTVFAVQRDMNETLHYVFSKKDKVYWIGFSNDQDLPYQLGMLVEVYKSVDWEKGDFGIFDY